MGRLILMPSTGWKVRLISGFLGLLAALGTVAALRVAEYGLVEADIIIVTAAFILTYIGGWPVGLVTATIVTVYSLYGVLTPIPEMSASSSLQHSLLVALSTGLGVMLANWKRRHAENSASSLDSAMAALAEQRERRQAVEAALQEAEARLHLVLAHSPISLFAQDQRLRYIWCHAGDAPAKGNPHIGDTDHDWLPEPDAERITRYKRQVLETGTGIRCDEHVTIKGQPHDFVVSIEPMRDAEGNVRGLIGAAVEVTAERRAKDVARESEARFRLALQHGPIFMSTQDLDLRYTWAYGPRLGIKPEAVVGRTDAEIYAPEDASTLTTLKRGTLETGLGTRQMASVVFSGSPHVFDLIIEPLRDSSGTIQGLTCAAIDMTEEFARRDALEHARAEAERANQAKSRFFAAASHDLRQPFQAMRLFLHLLETRLTEPQQMELAAKLGDSLRAGEGLLNALLDISSLEAATVKPSVVSFPIQDLLRRLADEFAPQAAAKGLEWRTVACSQRISSDPTLLERMVRNLLANAVRYTQKGGILLGCRPCPSGVRIEVLDTGPGIPADKTTLIFEEFHQLDNAARDRTQGLGLGLAIVQRTGHLLGHKVDVRSRPGKGSVFSIEVPLAASAQRHIIRVVPPTTTAALRGATVAVIEDDRLQLMALKTMLEDWGCEAVTATSAAAALDQLRKTGKAPDLVLSDFRLPGEISGPQAIRQIRSEFGENIPGLLVTGDTGADIKRRAGQDRLGVLHKPLHPNRLRAAMELALAKSA